jgi:hypothetical protein
MNNYRFQTPSKTFECCDATQTSGCMYEDQLDESDLHCDTTSNSNPFFPAMLSNAGGCPGSQPYRLTCAGNCGCDSCPAGTYVSTAAAKFEKRVCTDCTTPTHTSLSAASAPDGKANSYELADGTYSMSTDASSCLSMDPTFTCGAGEYVTASATTSAVRTCGTCDASSHEYTTGAYTNLAACFTKRTCSAGYFYKINNNMMDSTCVPCHHNTYITNAQQVGLGGRVSACTQCPAGTVTVVTGAIHSMSCVEVEVIPLPSTHRVWFYQVRLPFEKH